ncbi:JAB domain-containing protein [Sphingorhabdus sp. M41]|uniref:JAB domain-containing protein n=1 Tax=Sphingorhabdus sp. M41 TaxID=1806885 RepID=UPI0009EEAC15|nr:JAB domain-containing protein [Sphingorhabdus sp. M41]
MRKSILAVMRSFTPDNRSSGPRHEIARHDDSPKSLYDHANSLFLSIIGSADDGHILPSETTENHRDRQVLAQLIEIVEPDQAGRISRELLEEFGSIGRMLAESEAALNRVLGNNEPVLKLLKATEKFMLANLRNELPRKLISATDQRLVKYLQARMGSRTNEIMRILFLDSSHHLLSDQEFGDGSPQRIYVRPRSILKRALELDASGIILAHNHPGGSVTPSKSDIEFTRSIHALCLELEICLHDHIIITRDRWASFRKLKII